ITRAAACLAGDHDTTQAQADAITAQITAKEAAVSRYQAAFENGTMDDVTAGPRLRQLATEITQLKARRDQLTDIIGSAPQAPHPDTLAPLAGYLPQIITTSGTPIERKAAIEALIHEIRITQEGGLIPVFKIPPPGAPVPGADAPSANHGT